MLARLADVRAGEGEAGPFASECLTEDYELGLLVSLNNARSRFLRLRDADGDLVATRAYFPAELDESVRQKSRWIHGIAFQGWDRLGWQGKPVDMWMALRDRRGPLTALVLAAAYLLVVVEAVLVFARMLGWNGQMATSTTLRVMVLACFVSFVWRAAWRFAFTASEYGVAEGLRAVLRIPLANIIAIMSGRRALAAYLRTLVGGLVSWEKTSHSAHPADLLSAAPAPVVRAAP
jgi:adsorption protein B